MKELKDVMQNSLKIMFTGILMYIISFLIIPFGCVILVGEWFWNLEGSLAVLFPIFSIISEIIITVVSMKKVKDWKIIFYWLMGDLLYCCLIAVYHPPGIYGIGERGALFSTENTYETDMFELMVSLGAVFIIQVLVGIMVGISRLIKKWKVSYKQEKLQKPDRKVGNIFNDLEMSDISSNSFFIKFMLSVGITLLLFIAAFLMQYFFDSVDSLCEIVLLLLEVISIVAIWSKKHRRVCNRYLYIVGTILCEIILLIMIWSRHIGERERDYLLGGNSEFDSTGAIAELVPAFAGAVIIAVLIRLIVRLCQLVKRLIKKHKNEWLE